MAIIETENHRIANKMAIFCNRKPSFFRNDSPFFLHLQSKIPKDFGISSAIRYTVVFVICHAVSPHSVLDFVHGDVAVFSQS